MCGKEAESINHVFHIVRYLSLFEIIFSKSEVYLGVSFPHSLGEMVDNWSVGTFIVAICCFGGISHLWFFILLKKKEGEDCQWFSVIHRSFIS